MDSEDDEEPDPPKSHERSITCYDSEGHRTHVYKLPLKEAHRASRLAVNLRDDGYIVRVRPAISDTIRKTIYAQYRKTN